VFIRPSVAVFLCLALQVLSARLHQPLLLVVQGVTHARELPTLLVQFAMRAHIALLPVLQLNLAPLVLCVMQLAWLIPNRALLVRFVERMACLLV
jgi:hypothetical protein